MRFHYRALQLNEQHFPFFFTCRPLAREKRLQLNADKTEVLWFGSTSVSFISCHQTPEPLLSTRAPSNRKQLFVTLGCGSMPSCLCANASHGCRRRASTTCVVCVLYDSNLAVTSLEDWCRLSFCRDLTTVTLSYSRASSLDTGTVAESH